MAQFGLIQKRSQACGGGFYTVVEGEGGRTMSAGLGLTFCKAAVEAQGDQPGGIFCFTIPLPSGGVA
ncbi:MAG: hypothetical protein ACR2HJ_09035 [Fimbriimonadales bacterium]